MSLLFSIITSLLLGFCFGRPALILAQTLGLIDMPGSASHKTHKFPTPLAGGLLIILTLIVAIIVFQNSLNKSIVVTLSGSVVVFVFGVWDDKKGLSARPKLFGQFIAACV